MKQYTYLYTKDIVAYVKATYGISYSVSGMTYWLQRHQFSYKKPSLVPGKANLQEQQDWVDKYYDLRQNLDGNETICFADGVHPAHNTELSYG